MSSTIPKNVRQMGEPEEKRKIYVEDYVVTYLRQYAKEDIQRPRAAVLLGDSALQEEISYVFVRSALELPECVEPDNTVRITDQQWMDLYEVIEKWFQGQEILGWFLSTPGETPNITYELESAHRKYFPGTGRVLLLEDPTEGEEAFYVFEKDCLTLQKGYFIFYERNEPMQGYMLDRKDVKSVDAEADFSDRAARTFRSIAQEKKEESGQKKVTAFLYGLSTFLIMVVLVIGINMINNYEKMEQVELALQDLTYNLEMQQDLMREYTEPELKESPAEPEESVEEEIVPAVSQIEESVAEIPEYYIVCKGDTLLNISRKIYGDGEHIQEICELNGIEDCDVIFVGEKILLP